MHVYKKFIMRSLLQTSKLCHLKIGENFLLLSISLMLPSIIFSGCALLKKPDEPVQYSYEEQMPVRVHKQEMESMEIKIKSLEQKIAEKNALIKKITIREQDQPQVIPASSKEIAHTQVKLHRLATKPSSASLISEAEVAMDYVKQQLTVQSDEVLLEQAKQLLNAAVTSYSRADYATATYFASQALEFTNMISDQERERPNRATIRFNTPILLQTNTNTNLRREPGRRTFIVSVLKEGTILTANAYQGNWLMVQTDTNTQGWVFNSLVSTVADNLH